MSRLRNNLATVRFYAKSRKGDELLAERLAKLMSLSVSSSEVLAGMVGEDIDTVRDVLMGTEGDLGAAYWACLAAIFPSELSFPGRLYRGASDPINACLNYGYGILYSYAAGALDLAGLDPFAGVLHVDRPGRESLVMDLVELFRSAWIDRTLVSSLGRGWRPRMDDRFLCEETRRSLADTALLRLDNRVAFQGKNYRMQSLIVLQARALASYMRGDRDTLDIFTAPW